MNSKKIRVMLVDDHTVARNGVRLMLSSGADDIEVTAEAENAHQAMQLLKQQQFDVAVVDIAMPGKSGIELLKQIHAENPKLAVLILSMYPEDAYAVRVFKYGASGYLTKASSAETLIAAVRKVAAGGKYVGPSVVEKLARALAGDHISSHDMLSDRELEVLKLIAAGETLTRIAEILHISPNTVATYRARILEKTGMKGNVELVHYALENGLLA